MLKRGFQFAPGYRLEQFLGRGQFGQVWRASAPGGTAAAVKFIDLNGSEGHKEYAGIKRVKLIRHANLMPITAIWLLNAEGQVLDDFPDEAVETMDVSAVASASSPPKESRVIAEAHWLVVAMLLGGKSLHERLRECRKEGQPGIPPRELMGYIEDSAKGLDFLNSPQHDLGEGPVAIQHCDVKPANIVLMGSSAVVCDFGLAKILSRNQATATSAAGTPAYMAPEAINGRPSRTTDQYSLALSYYHLRTGTLPTADGSVWQILDAHRRGLLDLTAVTEPEQQVLRQATALDWQNRFESCVDLADALRDALRAAGQTKPGAFAWSAGTPPNIADSPSQGSNPVVPTAATMQPQPTALDASVIPAAVTNNDPTATLESVSLKAATTAYGSSPALVQTLVGPAEVTVGETPAAPAMPLVQPTSQSPVISQDSSQQRNLIMIASGVAVVMMIALGLLWNPFRKEPIAEIPSKDSQPDITKTDPAAVNHQLSPQNNLTLDTPEAIYAQVDLDYEKAVNQFKVALERDPELATVHPIIVGGHQNEVQGLAFDPSHTQVLSFAGEPEIFVHPLNKPEDKAVMLEGHSKALLGIAFHPRQPTLLSVGYSHGEAFLWNWQDPSSPKKQPLPWGLDERSVIAFAWHPQEFAFAAIMEDHQLGVWDLTSTPFRYRFLPAQNEWIDLKFDGSGTHVVLLTSPDDKQSPSKLFTSPWNELKQSIEHEGDVKSVQVGDASQLVKRIATFVNEESKLVVAGEIRGS